MCARTWNGHANSSISKHFQSWCHNFFVSSNKGDQGQKKYLHRHHGCVVFLNSSMKQSFTHTLESSVLVRFGLCFFFSHISWFQFDIKLKNCHNNFAWIHFLKILTFSSKNFKITWNMCWSHLEIVPGDVTISHDKESYISSYLFDLKNHQQHSSITVIIGQWSQYRWNVSLILLVYQCCKRAKSRKPFCSQIFFCNWRGQQWLGIKTKRGE